MDDLLECLFETGVYNLEPVLFRFKPKFLLTIVLLFGSFRVLLCTLLWILTFRFFFD